MWYWKHTPVAPTVVGLTIFFLWVPSLDSSQNLRITGTPVSWKTRKRDEFTWRFPTALSTTLMRSAMRVAPFPWFTCVSTAQIGRSEEHTSELQSHVNLVCRL